MKSVAASGTDDQGIQQIAEAFEIWANAQQ
jgi:hypothetical protein